MAYEGETLDFTTDDIIGVELSYDEDTDTVGIALVLNTLHVGEGDSFVFRHGAWVVEAGGSDANDRMFAFMVSG